MTLIFSFQPIATPVSPPTVIQVRYYANGVAPNNFPFKFQDETSYTLKECNLPTNKVEKNDVIINFNKTELREMEVSAFKSLLSKVKDGQRCTVQILKAGYPKEMITRGADLPDISGEIGACPNCHAEITITKASNFYRHVNTCKGAKASEIKCDCGRVFKNEEQQKNHRCRKSSVVSDNFDCDDADSNGANKSVDEPAPSSHHDVNDSVMSEPAQEREEIGDEINLDNLDTSSMEAEAEVPPDLCDFDLIKIHYKQPKQGQKYFTVTSTGSVIGSNLREVDDGDYILYCNKSDIRELNAYEANRICCDVKENTWMTIIVLKAGHEDDENFMELLRYL